MRRHLAVTALWCVALPCACVVVVLTPFAWAHRNLEAACFDMLRAIGRLEARR